MLTAVLLVIARAAARWRSSSADAQAAGEERESLWDPERLRRALIAWLVALFRRASPAPASVSSTAASGVQIGTAPSATSVRELYRQLLGLGETVGAHRRPFTTPLEHLPALQQSLVPEDDVAQLTAAYLAVRYAEHEATQAEIAHLRDRLDRVHARDAPDEVRDAY
ncbi:MAG: DUF4129 domain-containing protein [Chloroflexi bacterium]|nr:DUF4129 domain-containing protein [Chloroflexota bacterium]